MVPDVHFRPRKLRKLFSLSSLIRVVKVSAHACAACGAVSLHLDPAALIKMAGDPGAEDSPARDSAGGESPAT
jgi:hypothetical protein